MKKKYQEYITWISDLTDYKLNEMNNLNELIDMMKEQEDKLETRLADIPPHLQDEEIGTLIEEIIQHLSYTIPELEDIEFKENDSELEIQEKLDLAKGILEEFVGEFDFYRFDKTAK